MREGLLRHLFARLWWVLTSWWLHVQYEGMEQFPKRGLFVVRQYGARVHPAPIVQLDLVLGFEGLTVVKQPNFFGDNEWGPLLYWVRFGLDLRRPEQYDVGESALRWWQRFSFARGMNTICYWREER